MRPAAHEPVASSSPPVPADASAASAASRDDLLWWIARATSPLVGGEFLRSLVADLGRGLDLTLVFVAECVDHPVTRLRTIAVWSCAGPRDNFEFELRGTPCDEAVRDGRICWIPEGVDALFPREAGKGRYGYYGVPIFEAAGGRVIGHLAFFDRRRMERDVFDDPVFHILAARAAAEVQRRHAQESADERLHQLAHLSRLGAMNEMASLIAHEVNQPLATILSQSENCLEWLRRLPGIPPELIEALASVASEAERAGEVIRRLRTFVRKGQGQLEEAEVCAVIREAAELARPEARRANVRLQVEADAPLGRARMDRVQIEQVVLNLIRNAVEALRDSPRAGREVRVSAALAPSCGVKITVEDTGPGVDPALADRIFDPFFTTKKSGLGMGLAICRSIVESHGGRLWRDARGAGGAAFHFSLPSLQAAG